MKKQMLLVSLILGHLNSYAYDLTSSYYVGDYKSVNKVTSPLKVADDACQESIKMAISLGSENCAKKSLGDLFIPEKIVPLESRYNEFRQSASCKIKIYGHCRTVSNELGNLK